MHRGELDAAIFSQPMQINGEVVFGGCQIAVHLVQKTTAASREKIFGRGILCWVTVGNNARTAADGGDEPAQHPGMGSHLVPVVFVIALEKRRTCVNND